MRTHRVGKKLAITGAAVLIVGALFWLSANTPSISLRLKTAGALVNLVVPQGKWRPLNIFTRKPVQKEYLIESSSGRRLIIRVYQGSKTAPSPAVLVYTPFIGEGLDDYRLVNLAETFSRSGFAAVTVGRLEERLVVSRKDSEDIISAAIFIKNNPDIKISKFGLFGISYGSGPAIIASADKRIKDWVDFVVSFGGYYSFQETVEFAAGEQSHHYARAILEKNVEYYGTDKETFLQGIEFDELKRDLSPANVVDELEANFFIVHSVDDSFIPHTQSIKLAGAVSGRLPTYFTLTSIFEHGSYKKLTFENLRKHYFPDLTSLYDLLFAFFSKTL